MKFKLIIICILFSFQSISNDEVSISLSSSPSVEIDEDKRHSELRKLFKSIVVKVDNWDLDNLSDDFHEDAIVTWPDATTSKGTKEIIRYLKEKTSGGTKVVESFKSGIQVDELTRLYEGEVGISFGQSNDSFIMTDGNEIHVPGRWSTTLLKNNGKWQIINLHSSTDLFDNPLVNNAKRYAIIFIIIAFIFGVFLGLFISKNKSKKIKTS